MPAQGFDRNSHHLSVSHKAFHANAPVRNPHRERTVDISV
ncbi:MAG: hypothetical protein QOI13_2539 [Paraburkholderia sp.]|jgi:hypothetical protein|nr:hypothetical protein [Paraburkholderia sp.]